MQQHVNVRQVPGTNGWSTDRRDDSPFGSSAYGVCGLSCGVCLWGFRASVCSPWGLVRCGPRV